MSCTTPEFEGMLGRLHDGDRVVRVRAARELGESHDPRAAEPLLPCLSDRSAPVRARAAASLGRLRAAAAVSPLIALLNDPNERVKAAASSALKSIGRPSYRPLLAAYRAATGPPRLSLLKVLSGFKSTGVTDLLIAAAGGTDRAVQLVAIRQLGIRKDRRALVPLVKLLEQDTAALDATAPDPDHAGACGRQSVAATWSGAGPRLQFTISALGAIGDPGAFEPLRNLLGSGRLWVRAGFVCHLVSALRAIDRVRASTLPDEWLGVSLDLAPAGLVETPAGMGLSEAMPGRGVGTQGDPVMLCRALSAAGEALVQILSRQGIRSGSERVVPRPHHRRYEVNRRLEAWLRGRGMDGGTDPESR